MRHAPDAPDTPIVWSVAARCNERRRFRCPIRPLRTAILTILHDRHPHRRVLRRSQTAGTPPPTTAPQLRFDIAAGPLADALAAFEASPGLKVQTTAAVTQLRLARSDGFAHGAEALAPLIGGTGLTLRVHSPGTFAARNRCGGAANRDHRLTCPATSPTNPQPPRRRQRRCSTCRRHVTVVPRALMADQQAQSVGGCGQERTWRVGRAGRRQPRSDRAPRHQQRVGLLRQRSPRRSGTLPRSVQRAEHRGTSGTGCDALRPRRCRRRRQPRHRAPDARRALRGRLGGGRGWSQARHGANRRIDRRGVSLRVSAMGQKTPADSVTDSFSSGMPSIPCQRDAWRAVHLTLRTSTCATIGWRTAASRRKRPPDDVDARQLFGSRSQNDAESGVDSAGLTLEHRFARPCAPQQLSGRPLRQVLSERLPGQRGQRRRDVDARRVRPRHRSHQRLQSDGSDLSSAGSAEGRTCCSPASSPDDQSQDELRHTARSIAEVPLNDRFATRTSGARPSCSIARRRTVLAGFMQDQITLAAHWKAVGGIRVDRFAVAWTIVFPPIRTCRGPISPPARARASSISPGSGVSIYSSYSYTFLPSGQTLGLAANTVDLGPENAKNYEVGAKVEVLHRRLTLAAALFRLDRSNMKSVDPNDPTRLVLTGQQRTDGLTVTAAGRLGSRIELYGGYAEFDAESRERRPPLLPDISPGWCRTARRHCGYRTTSQRACALPEVSSLRRKCSRRSRML